MSLWTANDYEGLFFAATSGCHYYASDFRGGEEDHVKSLVLSWSGRYLNDYNRKDLVEIALASDCHYFRPIPDWKAGLRIYAGFTNKDFFARHYLASTPYAHQVPWRKNWGRRRHLQLAPRSHGKSRVYSFELPVWNIAYIDNVRLLHVTNGGQQAKKYLVVIRDQWEHNATLISDFGNLSKGLDDDGLETDLSGSWSASMFYVRRSNNTLKDPTMQAIGVNNAITGSRFDGIIADDIIEEADMDTVEKRVDVEAWWNAVILELLDESGWALMIGTRKHGDDLYERMMKKPTWTYGVNKAILKYPSYHKFIMEKDENDFDKLKSIEHSGDGIVLAPDMWPMEKMLEKKLQNETTPWVFDREQQQEVQEEKNKIFQSVWMDGNDFEFTATGNLLRLTDQRVIDMDDLVIIDGTDLAISKNESADYFVVITIGMDTKFNSYVLDLVQNRYTFDEQKDKIVGQHRKWGSQLVGIEDVAYQQALEQHLIANTEVPAIGVPRYKDKVTRALRIQPYFQNRKVYFLKGKMAMLKGQLNDFPFSAHDDMFDALETAIMLGVLRVKQLKDLREKVAGTQVTESQFRDVEAIRDAIGEWH